MSVLVILLPFVLLGIVVSSSRSPAGRAPRARPISRAEAASSVVIPLLYIGLGIAIPAVVIANRGEHEAAWAT